MISIIVPVYQAEKALSRCIESMCRQSYVDLEIILVDDGSTDHSGQICDEFAKKDARIRVLHKENEGVSNARNSGLKRATGTYVQFVDSDDYLDAHCCEKLVNAVENTGADIGLCGYHHWYYGCDVIKQLPFEGVLLLQQMELELLELYDKGFFNMPWNKLFRREAIHQMFDPNLSLGEDLLFNLSYMKGAESMVLVKEPLYHYIQDGNVQSLSTQKRKDKLEIAMRIQYEVQQFYIGKIGKEPKRPILDERFLREFMDEIESLPSQKNLKREEKKAVIRNLCNHPVIKKASQKVRFKQIDYVLLHFFFKRRMVSAVYFLAEMRAWILGVIRRG